MVMKNYYQILNIPYDAEPAAIKAAYRRLVKRHHPDVARSSADDFKLIKEAYDTLSNPIHRRQYNRQLGLFLMPGSAFRSDRIYMPPVARDVFDDLVDVLADRFKLPRRKRLDIDLYLSEREFADGANTIVAIPFDKICPRCFGFGGTLLSTCGACNGLGIVSHDIELKISLKPPLAPGQLYEVVANDYILQFRIKRGG
jgi:molecular chaperone DnaJ